MPNLTGNRNSGDYTPYKTLHLRICSFYLHNNYKDVFGNEGRRDYLIYRECP